MANTKWTGLTENTAPVGGDKMPHVDISDVSMAATGTNKFTTVTNLLRYPEIFDSTDLDGSGDIVITHNRGYQYPQVTIVDDSDVRVDGYKVTYDSTTALTEGF